MKNNGDIDDTINFYLNDEVPLKSLRDKTDTLLEDLSGTNLGYLLQKIQTTNSIPDLFIYMGLILFAIASKKQNNSKKKNAVLMMIKTIIDQHNL